MHVFLTKGNLFPQATHCWPALQTEFRAKIDIPHVIVGQNGVGVPFGNDPPVADDIGTITDSQRFTDIVIGHQNANTDIAQVLNDLLDVDNRNRVDAGKRFVQQYETRLGCQCPGNLKTPPLTT